MNGLQKEAYELNSISWAELKKYAEKVAKTATFPRTSNNSWVLMSRYWNKEQKTQHTLDETNEITHYCLRDTGELFVRYETTETAVPLTGGHVISNSNDATERPFTLTDAYMFDFKPKHYETYGENPKIWTNRDNSDELVVHGKGFGLSLALRRLL